MKSRKCDEYLRKNKAIIICGRIVYVKKSNNKQSNNNMKIDNNMKFNNTKFIYKFYNGRKIINNVWL